MMPVLRCLFSQHTDACSHHIYCGGVQILTAVQGLVNFRNIQDVDWPIHVLACSNPMDRKKSQLKLHLISLCKILLIKTASNYQETKNLAQTIFDIICQTFPFFR